MCRQVRFATLKEGCGVELRWALPGLDSRGGCLSILMFAFSSLFGRIAAKSVQSGVISLCGCGKFVNVYNDRRSAFPPSRLAV
jgi:hypothetical protein